MESVKLDVLRQTVIKDSQKPTTNKEEEKLRASAKQLEGLFLTFVLKAMEKTIPRFDDKKQSNNLVSMMFSSVMGEDLAQRGGVGLAEFIYRNMHKGENSVQNLELPAQNWIDLVPQNIISGRNNE
ncbi:hypothetical protein ACX8XP_01940 [Calditrichota bacterium LG25]